MNIEQLLPVNAEFNHSYYKHIDIGKNSLKNLKIIFAGLARNLETKIQSNIEKLSVLGAEAKDYKILIFENDSEDNTKSIIQDLTQQENSHVVLVSQNNGRPQFGTVKDIKRTMALAEYRNVLNKYIETNLYDYEIVVVVDLDFVDFSRLGFYNSLGWLREFPDRIDAVAGNSFEYKNVTLADKKSLWNYDSWAFRYNWWNELSGLDSMSYNSMLWFGFFIMPVGLSVIPVNSAFGGMCLYKTEQYTQASYDGYDCEHVCLHHNLKKIIKPSFQMVLNPSQVMLL